MVLAGTDDTTDIVSILGDLLVSVSVSASNCYTLGLGIGSFTSLGLNFIGKDFY